MAPPRLDFDRLKRALTLTARRVAVMSAALVAAFVLIAAGASWHWAFHDLPEPPEGEEALWAVRREPAVTLLDASGAVLSVRGPLYGEPARLEELPTHVPLAFVAIEDRRFYEHGGVDYTGLMRAFAVNLRERAAVQGGSTLTMQLVKNLILSPERTLRRKLQEIRLAWAIEERLTKDEILELYLNRVYLGERAYGVDAASRRYFDKPPAELSVAEAALLAALPKAPSRLAPTENLAAARERAEAVLDAMLRAGYITPAQHLQALAAPAELSPAAEAGVDPAVFGHAFDYAMAEAERLLGGDPPPDLVIATTLDPRLQTRAHQAVAARLDGAPPERQAALVALAPDGAVRAMTGGRDYAESQFNRAVQARRQPGSAFKPVVFAAALEAGYDPAAAFDDRPIDLEGWSPENFGGGYRGRITLEDALKRSINTVAAQVVAEIGAASVVEAARRLGIDDPMSDVPAIALGAEEVRLIELTGAYATIAADGRLVEPWMIREIRSNRGEVLYRREPQASATQAIAPRDARALSTMLEAVIRDGTGSAAALSDRRAAGKTGTSQNNRDAWFLGFTADYVTGVWIGHDDEARMEGVTGGGTPALIWRDFMAMAHQNLEPAPLAAPEPRRRDARSERLAAFYSALSRELGSAFAPEPPAGSEPAPPGAG